MMPEMLQSRSSLTTIWKPARPFRLHMGLAHAQSNAKVEIITNALLFRTERSAHVNGISLLSRSFYNIAPCRMRRQGQRVEKSATTVEIWTDIFNPSQYAQLFREEHPVNSVTSKGSSRESALASRLL